MNNVERFKAVMSFRPVDRVPCIEWAEYWDKTVARWHGEGLPTDLVGASNLRSYFGLDAYDHLWTSPRHTQYPLPDNVFIKNKNDYHSIKPFLYSDYGHDDELRKIAHRHQCGQSVFWITLEGFFWFPRTLFGIERHLYSFYDEPELMHEINNDLADYYVYLLEQISHYCIPDFMTFAEDMSYNHGPMLSETCFEEFIAP